MTKRNPEDDHDSDEVRTRSNHVSPLPPPLGSGRLVDKEV